MKYKRASLIDFVVDPPVEIVKLITRINSTPAFLKDRNDLFFPSLEVLAEKTGMALSLALIYHSNPNHIEGSNSDGGKPQYR